MKLTHTFEISEEAFNLLKEIHKVGSAEYRDTEFETLNDFQPSKVLTGRDDEWFLNRNFGGTYHLIDELLKFDLIGNDHMSWHTTFVVTEIGKQVIAQNT
jgi:hypothetical protein